jgi:selenocysteine-specific translation elongation factor
MSTGRLNKQKKRNETMKITSKKLDSRSRSYIIESPFYGERVNIITDKGFHMKHCILMIGCNGIQIERREFAKLLWTSRRLEREAA